jgi:glutamate-1-semialdehyde 2,1-aminomutase
MGVVLPEDGFLQGLRDLCDGKRTLLIFDEVITGFRLDLGGAQKLYGIKADITTLGKIVGGGLPLAAVGGRAEIMDLLAPVGGVYQAGTLSGNPIATAAANATIDILLRQKDIYKRLEEKGALLEKGLLEAAKKAKISVTINRAGSLLSCFFTPAACPLGTAGVRNFTDVQSTNIRMFKKFFLEMLNQGIYLAPSAYEAMFISIAHTKQDIEKTVKSAENAFRKIR